MAKCIYSGARIPLAADLKETHIFCNACNKEVKVTLYAKQGRYGVGRVEDHDESPEVK